MQSKPPEFRGSRAFRRAFVLNRFPNEVAGAERADRQLSNAATSIKIGPRVWKIGDPIHSNVTALANQQLKN